MVKVGYIVFEPDTLATKPHKFCGIIYYVRDQEITLKREKTVQM
jgi:hypothetical protein